MIRLSSWTMEPQEYTTFGTYPSLSFSFGINKGVDNRPISFSGFLRSSKETPRTYSLTGPTPCVITNQPSGVSIGDPQFPICTNSHGYFGVCKRLACLHIFIFSEKEI